MLATRRILAFQRRLIAFPTARGVQNRLISDLTSAEEWKQLSPAKVGAPPTLAFFTAAWCQPCRDVIPHLEDVESKFAGPNLRIVRVDVSVLPELANSEGVEVVPQILVLRDGHVVERMAGNGGKEIQEMARRHATAYAEFVRKKKGE
eukprot:TRINITY_DN20735_c0_g3_i1.p1 TRINITY_DN20735_c0_g3~~TRINITY_DN20735_c0_g3_i1.p1  ORF type:complete len:148 (-),score=28.77 TRINITY_DN20735_c0_g3_i1:73-516(-)